MRYLELNNMELVYKNLADVICHKCHCYPCVCNSPGLKAQIDAYIKESNEFWKNVFTTEFHRSNMEHKLLTPEERYQASEDFKSYCLAYNNYAGGNHDNTQNCPTEEPTGENPTGEKGKPSKEIS
jgi:hypothetical protein